MLTNTNRKRTLLFITNTINQSWPFESAEFLIKKKEEAKQTINITESTSIQIKYSKTSLLRSSIVKHRF